MADAKSYIVRTPLFPTYNEVRELLKVWDGTPRSTVLTMTKEIWDQTGTPQNPVDWSNPDIWLEERLTEPGKSLAQRIWIDSRKTVNPRHTYGAYLFVNTHELLSAGTDGVYRLTEIGQRFLANDPETVRKIDHTEGLPQLLSILALHSPAKRGALVADWGAFVLENSKFGTSSTINDTLRRRILNLVERGYIDRQGNTYSITTKGVTYAAETGIGRESEPHQKILHALKAYNDEQTLQLRKRLGEMHPYRFESLIKDLLEKMDYEDVEVTKQSGDKGIDVIASYQFGITEIKEVVQVKRQQGSITRPILDQLRGALPYHQAIRGTIITLGKFAKGSREAAVFPGAAPITLIDGDKLIELLLKHDVGIKKRTVNLLEVDERFFENVDPEAAIPAEEE